MCCRTSGGRGSGQSFGSQIFYKFEDSEEILSNINLNVLGELISHLSSAASLEFESECLSQSNSQMYNFSLKSLM